MRVCPGATRPKSLSFPHLRVPAIFRIRPNGVLLPAASTVSGTKKPCHSPAESPLAAPVDRVALFASVAEGARPHRPRPIGCEAGLRWSI